MSVFVNFSCFYFLLFCDLLKIIFFTKKRQKLLKKGLKRLKTFKKRHFFEFLV